MPNASELGAETIDYDGTNANPTTGKVKVIDSATAFSNFLKFPVAGDRYDFGGSMGSQGSWGYVWTSSVNGSYSVYESFDSGYADWLSNDRAGGLSVRCVKN